MDPADLLDFVLGRLDDPRRAQIENAIRSDADLARKVERLRHNLDRLLEDGRDQDSPNESQPPPPLPPDSSAVPPRSD